MRKRARLLEQVSLICAISGLSTSPYYDFKIPKGKTPRRKGNGGTTRYVEYVDKNGKKQIKRVKGMVD